MIVAGVWGGSFMLTAIAIRDLSVPVVALFRTGVGALVLLPIALRRGALADLRGQLWPVFLLGVVQLAAPFLLLGYGQRSVPSGLAGILVSSMPLWTALLAVWIDHEERTRGRGLLGLAVGIVGVALLCGLELSGNLDTLLGAAMLLLGALSYALGGSWASTDCAACHRLARSQARWWAEASRSRPLRWQLCPTTLRLSAR